MYTLTHKHTQPVLSGEKDARDVGLTGGVIRRGNFLLIVVLSFLKGAGALSLSPFPLACGNLCLA